MFPISAHRGQKKMDLKGEYSQEGNFENWRIELTVY
jgi:hypothetical protein